MPKFPILAPALLTAAFAVGVNAQSNVRIVRFTLVTGAVQTRLSSSAPWVPATVDAPVLAGEQVRTLASGRAEVQLEYGSTVRLIPNSTLAFPTLARRANGEPQTVATLLSGTAFVSLFKGDDQGFSLHLPNGDVVTGGNRSDFRADLTHAVTLSGAAAVNGHTLPRATAQDPWDQWSTQRDDYYNNAFMHGVTPGASSSVVNWGAKTLPMPAYTSNGLTYTGSQSCPWTMNHGDYSGWCWTDAQGWFRPSSPVTADPQAAASASDISQTRATAHSIAAAARGHNVDNLAPLAGCAPSLANTGFGGGDPSFYAADQLAHPCTADLWAQLFPNEIYYPSERVVSASTSSPIGRLPGKHGKLPGRPIFHPATAGRLAPPPTRTVAFARSGVDISHTHSFGGSGYSSVSGSHIRAGGSRSGGSVIASATAREFSSGSSSLHGGSSGGGMSSSHASGGSSGGSSGGGASASHVVH